MTREEAAKTLTELRRLPLLLTEKEAEAVDIALESLDKQIPKKPELVPIKENTRHTWKCPTCGGYEILKFCQHCGQKISWE